MKTTKYGIEYQFTDAIDETWIDYHKTSLISIISLTKIPS